MELYLLVPTDDREVYRSIDADGRCLQLTGPYDIDNPQSIPPYACVSYVWGENRLENPIFPTRLISDYTLPALGAVIRSVSSEISAFWIDAFCIPQHQPARSATLESMGYIYSAADRVVAALGSECCEALFEMTKQDWLTEELLAPLESNFWVTSVWTYQEIVNAQRPLITCTADGSPTLDGDTFLDRIGYSLDKYKKPRDLNSFDMRRIWPHLDALEDMGGDYMKYNPFQRPALHVMSMLDRRVALDERNKYYAMIGALTSEVTGRADTVGGGLSGLRKKVMTICEGKADWSFLYSSTVRDQAEPWMPSSDHELKSCLPYFMHGTQQSGRRDKHGRVWLENVLVITNVLKGDDEVDFAAVKHTIAKLPLNVTVPTNASLGDLKEKMRSVLLSAGFTGTGEGLILAHGIFYPQISIPEGMNMDIIICTELRWTFAQPGMLIATTDVTMICIPGILVGQIDPHLGIGAYMLGPR